MPTNLGEQDPIDQRELFACSVIRSDGGLPLNRSWRTKTPYGDSNIREALVSISTSCLYPL